MANLYEINAEIAACIDPETGEIIDVERLMSLQMDFNTKIGNIARWIKNLRSDAEAYKKEKEVFTKREKQARVQEEQLKNLLKDTLQGGSFKDNQVEITFRKSTQVQVEDENQIPQQFLRMKVEREPDKAKIAAALKAGEEVSGCTLVQNKTIQIK